MRMLDELKDVMWEGGDLSDLGSRGHWMLICGLDLVLVTRKMLLPFFLLTLKVKVIFHVKSF